VNAEMSGVSSANSMPGQKQSSDYLLRARSLRPLIEAEADESERNGNITPATVDGLAEAGLFWMLVPRIWGGGGQDIVTFLEVLEEISWADASTGWSLMANVASAGMVSGFLDDDGAEVLYGGAKLAITAGQFAPSGKGVRTASGYRVSGNYQFGSGTNHADWIGGGFIVMEDGAPRRTADGQPDMRVALVPRDRVVFRGNWNVMGLQGTGSEDYQIPEQEVPERFTMLRVADRPKRPDLVFGVGTQGIGIGGHLGVVLGLMKRALEEVAKITLGKSRAGYSTTVDKNPVFLYEFARHEALYQACRAYVFKAYGDAQTAVSLGEPLTAEHRARMRQSATWAHEVLTDVVGFCHLYGASQSLRVPSLLGRVSRDTAVATQHVLIDPNTLVDTAVPLLEKWRSVGTAG
jgi:indole-3-acetate monooxygenase